MQGNGQHQGQTSITSTLVIGNGGLDVNSLAPLILIKGTHSKDPQSYFIDVQHIGVVKTIGRHCLTIKQQDIGLIP